jgi:signal transduction histidine kinase
LAHDGWVSADSTVGSGTRIRFVLPVSSGKNGENHAS